MRKPFFLLVSIALFAAGCSARTYVPRDVSGYVWPPPPERPRVRMVKYIFSELDVRSQNTQELLFGTDRLFTFTKPHRIAVDRKGNIYLTDTIARTVYIINLEQGLLTDLLNPRGWKEPSGVAVNDEDGLLAASNGATIEIFDLNTKKHKYTIGGDFVHPSGLAFDPQRKTLYVSDPKKSEVSAYSYDGKKIATIAGPGVAPGKVYYPGGIAVDGEGRLYIVDTMNFRVQIFNPDGTFYGTFGSHGTKPGMFARPKDIAVSKDGLLFVTDAAFGNFQVLDRLGRVYLFVGTPGLQLYQLNTPQGIFVNENNRIYVVDQTNRMVKIYELLTDDYYAAHPDEAAKYKPPKTYESIEEAMEHRKKEAEAGGAEADGAEGSARAAGEEAYGDEYDEDFEFSDSGDETDEDMEGAAVDDFLDVGW